MPTLAYAGTEGSPAWRAARSYGGASRLVACPDTRALLDLFNGGGADFALFPVYNTLEGEQKRHFRFFDRIPGGFWVDNVVLYSQISLGVFPETASLDGIATVLGERETLSQCEDYIETRLPGAVRTSVRDVARALAGAERSGRAGLAALESEERLRALGLTVLEREIAPYNRTRYAVFGHSLAHAGGYDATVFITQPLPDRVGILVDILGEFSRRGVNILDLRTENDVKTQKLRIYLEVEGHAADPGVREAIGHIEAKLIRQPGSIRLLGSFPRVDMRTKNIKSFGFIGTGAMSRWFAERLEGEGYKVLMSGRTSELKPEEMARMVDVVAICVPISATPGAVRRYGPLLRKGQALVLLAGAAGESVAAALEVCDPEVEVMLVHNLWGPKAATMRDKNAIVARTARSGVLCSEFESFLYKHGADIIHDTPERHDLLMGIGQRLPTLISVALAKSLHDNGVTGEDLAGHCTLTSLYPILAMARVHAQNPRTYAEIMATGGDSCKISRDFVRNLADIARLADAGAIDELSARIDANARAFDPEFLAGCMSRAKAVDEVLSRML